MPGPSNSTGSRADIQMPADVPAEPEFRIVYMGTPDFAVPALNALAAAGMKPLLVITQPDRPQGRKQRMTPPPVKETARKLSIDVLQPESLHRAEGKEIRAIMRTLDPHFLVTASYGKILPEAMLKLARIEAVNVHGSLLPAYRGASPVQQAIINGDAVTGITIMRMVKEMDKGPVFTAREWPIGPETTADELMAELALLAAEMLPDSLRRIASGDLLPAEQNEENASYVTMLDRDSGKIVWSDSAQTIHNLVRGTYSWPGAYSYLNGQRIKVHKTRFLSTGELIAAGGTELDNEQIDAAEPGTLVGQRKGLWVKTGHGILSLEEIQPSGKKVQLAREVSHNYETGMRFTDDLETENEGQSR